VEAVGDTDCVRKSPATVYLVGTGIPDASTAQAVAIQPIVFDPVRGFPGAAVVRAIVPFACGAILWPFGGEITYENVRGALAESSSCATCAVPTPGVTVGSVAAPERDTADPATCSTFFVGLPGSETLTLPAGNEQGHVKVSTLTA
jgi:hypothetical protein